MDNARSSRKAEQSLALALASVFLLVSAASSTPQVHAFGAVYVIINDASYGTFGSYNVVRANLTNPWSSSLDLIVFAVWKNSAYQTVAVSTGGITMSSTATGTSFAPLTSGLPRGMYTVNVFVITANNDPVTSTLSFVVVI